MEEKSNAFLETEPVGKLMAKYAVPYVISPGSSSAFLVRPMRAPIIRTLRFGASGFICA